MACADGIQECLETVRDLRANDAQENYMVGLEKKIKAVEKHAVAAELGNAVFVSGAQMILKLGIATVALVGGILLSKGSIDLLTFLCSYYWYQDFMTRCRFPCRTLLP